MRSSCAFYSGRLIFGSAIPNSSFTGDKIDADFLGRLTSLIPPPRKNMIRYHGIFAPNSALRAQVVPKPNLEIIEGQGSTEGNRCPGQGKRWAQLLARVFGIDVLACPRCESRMQMISFITESKAIRDILASLKWPPRPLRWLAPVA